MEEEGKIIRVRGGAMSVKEVQKASGEPYTKKATIHTDEKIEIAQKAAVLVDEGSSIFIDGGTTALYLAKELRDMNCNVFTNGIAVAKELAQKKNVTINLLGGQLIKENLSTASPLAAQYFTDTNFELAIISASAFTPENGFSCGSQIEADLLKLVRKKAKFLYMMLDSSKIGKISLIPLPAPRYQRPHYRRRFSRISQRTIQGDGYRRHVVSAHKHKVRPPDVCRTGVFSL